MTVDAHKLELIQMIIGMQDEDLLAKLLAMLKSESKAANGNRTPYPEPGGHLSRQFGFAEGLITYVAPDFDETPPGFEDYT
jgi:hypothetical protein